MMDNCHHAGEHGYPESWYPVARGCDVKPGQHIPVALFGTDWILFRAENGTVSVIGRRCCHMGADLAEGKVVKNTLECPLHGWCFDQQGHCTHIPDYSGQLPSASLSGLICEEHYGLIFVYWGKKPLFEPPGPPGQTGKLNFSDALEADLETSYLSLTLNAFDTQHFERIHNRRFLQPPEIRNINSFALGIYFQVEIIKRRWVDHVMSWVISGNSTISIECWGGNILLFSNRELESFGMVALQPLADDRCRAYLLALKPGQGRQTIVDKIRMKVAPYLIKGFLSPDIKATRNMTPFAGVLVSSLDYGVEKFWRYFSQLPRHPN